MFLQSKMHVKTRRCKTRVCNFLTSASQIEILGFSTCEDSYVASLLLLHGASALEEEARSERVQ